MLILHISDLHITDAEKTLNSVWNAPSRVIRDRGSQFDFVVVSGDLSQRADPAEYADLKEFTIDTLEPLLREPDPRRIVFVPGNHDVNWNQDIGRNVIVSQQSGEHLKEMVNKIKNKPFNRKYRMSLGEYGGADFFEINPELYQSRFKNVQEFLDGYYRPDNFTVNGKLQDKNFNLLADDREGDDWSAHLFLEEGVAFYGFNSCYRNDRYWTGAKISQESIANACRHAQLHASGLLLVAVWHHGWLPEAKRPDYVSIRDLGEMYISEFSIGLHGHTHKSEQNDLSWVFQDRFVISSTGSICADKKDRPDAAGNQFSIVQINPKLKKVNSSTYQRENVSSQYAIFREETLSYALQRPRTSENSSAKIHRREYTIDQDGIAKVKVVITRLNAQGQLTLALLSTPHCSSRGDKQASSSGGPLDVQRKEIGRKKVLYYIFFKERTYLDKLEWSYVVSNAYALSQLDISLREDTSRLKSTNSLTMYFRPHKVRFDCEKLNLNIRRSDGSKLTESRFAPIAEYTTFVDGEKTLKLDSDELLDLDASHEGSDLRLLVPTPRVGYRYAIAYEPPHYGNKLDNQTINLVDDILVECLTSRSTINIENMTNFGKVLTKSISTAINEVTESEYSGNWIGFLWKNELRRLVSAFGSFPPILWTPRFASGNGIAGHAFRFSHIARWYKNMPSDAALLYQEKPEGQYWDDNHEWIVCIPLIVEADGPSIGVISLEGNQSPNENAYRLLRDFARSGNAEFGMRLFTAVLQSFWTTVSGVDFALVGDVRNHAKKICDRVLPES